MGGEGHGDMGAEGLGYEIPPITPDSSYFTHNGYSSMIMAHIVFMTLAWVFALPISVMLSISRSRYASMSHFIFLFLNAMGLLFGTIFNANTPDLYENNAHHKIGWVATWVMAAQSIVGLIKLFARAEIPTPSFPGFSYERISQAHTQNEYRYSRDSGHGTEPDSPKSSCPPSRAESSDEVERISHEAHFEEHHEEKHGLLTSNTTTNKFRGRLFQLATMCASSRLMRYANLPYEIIDRTILFLGFIAFATGVVTYGGHFKGNEVFSGLAHFIKGGIFFWYGLLTLARVMGSFADLGWAWNFKPPASLVGARKAAAPSAEFVESLLIFIYGSTNVFLEHLGSTDGQWTAGDLEHVSISIMFFGGGLCGMLIESKRVRRLLNSAFATPDSHGFGQSLESLQEPRNYGFSTNPMPAIILLLLGLMISSHHQISPVSTMVHKQWGTLFLAGALARGVSYILVYLSPPASYLPSRPPSEIVVAFCLISGGLLFMGSASDIITGMEMYGLHAMFLFTVTMGFTALLMGWEICVLAIKGWAVRRERRRSPVSVA